jgi:hypothetical protein
MSKFDETNHSQTTVTLISILNDSVWIVFTSWVRYRLYKNKAWTYTLIIYLAVVFSHWRENLYQILMWIRNDAYVAILLVTFTFVSWSRAYKLWNHKQYFQSVMDWQFQTTYRSREIFTGRTKHFSKTLASLLPGHIGSVLRPEPLWNEFYNFDCGLHGHLNYVFSFLVAFFFIHMWE